VSLLAVAAVLVALLLYGNVVAYRAVRAPVVVAVNLVLGAGLVAVARASGASWQALGLGPGAVPRGLLWGAAVAAVVGAGGALVAITPLRRAFADLRTVRMVPRELAFHYLVRIPFGTALFEEVVFRGVVLALLALETTPLVAVVGSSIAFGLWHIGASLDFLRANRPHAGRTARLGAGATGIALTFTGGLAFAALRLAAGSLAAPVLAHAAINAVGLTLARATGAKGPREPAVP
jgi:uncharacterized protein